jgi:hypothetical protein
MQVYVFRGVGRVFAMTAQAGGENLPAQYGPWTAFKTVAMHPDEPQGGVDVNACLADIDAYGLHLTDAHVRITPLVTGDPAP